MKMFCKYYCKILAYCVLVVILSLLALQVPYVKNILVIPQCPIPNKVVKDIAMPYITNPNMFQIVVSYGDTMINILKSAGISDTEAYMIIQSLNEVYNVDKIRIGDQIIIKMNGYNHVDYVMVNNLSSVNNIKIYQNGEGHYNSQIVNSIKNKKVLRVSDTIRSSLFATAVEQGLSTSTIMKLIKLYSYNVDLQKEIVPGSKFDVLFERFFDEDGNPILDGKILYASLKIDNRNVNMYHHLLKNGSSGYFDSRGFSITKDLLQNPIEGNSFWVSSKFGHRKHPIYGYTRFHKGVDYAAAVGTPIRSASDGVVQYIGNKGGYGKYIKIKHSNVYSTVYAHISRFQKNITVGSKVKQGQVIAYVGNSGISTGPHLHYEVLYNDTPVDPLKVSARNEINKLSNDEMSLFQLTMSKINKKLDEIPYVTEFAMSNNK